MLEKLLLPPSKYNEFYDPRHTYYPSKGVVFVFGSNDKGIHGAGAALFARQACGAELGVSRGFTGNSYAIATKDENMRTKPLEEIIPQIQEFVRISRTQEFRFLVSAVGCGLAGYKARDIAPHFKSAMYCYFSSDWLPYL